MESTPSPARSPLAGAAMPSFYTGTPISSRETWSGAALRFRNLVDKTGKTA